MTRGFGDNSKQSPTLQIKVKMFNSLTKYAGGNTPVELDVPVGTMISDLVKRFQVPQDRIHLVLINGRDTCERMGEVNMERELENGDVVAMSGPIPYSYGYGAPVV